MTSRFGAIALGCLIAAAPALAAKVFIDYDKKADLESYKTWAYKENPEGRVQDDLMHDRIVDGLTKMLNEGRLQQVDDNPDLWVIYSVTTEERKQYNTTSMGYGYGGGYGSYGYYGYGGYGGIATSTTTEMTYTDGTLIVDVWDPKTNHLVWRGSATDTLKAKPDKIADQIEKFYAQMRAKWDKTVEQMRRDKEKAAKAAKS
jgi:hypothetical protein